MEGRIAILISHKNYLSFLNSFFNKSTTKHVKVFIFLFEISTSAFSLNLDELDRPYQMKHPHIDRTPHESRLHVVLYYISLLFVSRFLVFYKSLTRKSTTSWHHSIFSFYEAFIVYTYICATSGSMKLGYLRNTRILKFSRNDIIWCSYKKITFNTLYRLILG